MTLKESRREAVRSFKERKPSVGIYSVRCLSTSSAWVGMSNNLEATQNRIWFSLRNRQHQEKSLQEEWNRCGEGAFEYAIIHRVAGDVHPLELPDLLKALKSDYVVRLNARPLL